MNVGGSLVDAFGFNFEKKAEELWEIWSDIRTDVTEGDEIEITRCATRGGPIGNLIRDNICEQFEVVKTYRDDRILIEIKGENVVLYPGEYRKIR